ncbi:uncharacterized protein BX663DRAFT_436112 [Cokeromyces recurvatus]|uniref:uncharacterized protein n=1 Tax=Cokeromyces recurvatus TaxID=90255 RepID=UPI00221E6142|nr:uncharacterized protein BX663DRAFT_436112 [Cokeromyces recurvatus]KAI7902189.1 hypothetical protein BX663DRAFT_436112 [Cokeromyces recurvatus]
MFNFYLNENRKLNIENDKFVAAEYIKSGTVIVVQAPLASVPLPSKRHQRCNYCLRKAQLQCCSRCRSAYFCSNECFRNAWLHFHRVLCEPQETDIYKDIDADRWLLERTALVLHSHDRLNKQNSYVAEFLKLFDYQISQEDLDLLWHRIKLSSFPILDTEHHLDQVAIGVYPATSLLTNHSCCPNAALLYKQSTQYIVTIEDILPGEPITIAYVDLINTRARRMQKLKERFGPHFECQCMRCQGELSCLDAALEKGEECGLTEVEAVELMSRSIKTWSVLDMIKHAQMREKDSWSSIQVLEPPQFAHFVSRIAAPDIFYAFVEDKKLLPRESTYRVFSKEDRAYLRQCIKIVINTLLTVPHTPAFSLATIHAAESLLIDRIKRGSWVEASRCASYLIVVYRLIYPPLHPKVSYHTLILARSSWNALVEMELIGVNKKLENIYDVGTGNWIEIAKNAIDTTFGRDTTLWRDIIELQWVHDRERKVKKSTS